MQLVMLLLNRKALSPVVENLNKELYLQSLSFHKSCIEILVCGVSLLLMIQAGKT